MRTDLGELQVRVRKQCQLDAKKRAWTGCSRWYRTEAGKVAALWPGFIGGYVAAIRQLDWAHDTLD